MGNNLPTYQNLFGTDNYYTVPDSRSVLSPAAYLAELLRLVEHNIQGQNLKTRRPDIYSLLLNTLNTENELSKLEIVNKVMNTRLNLPKGALSQAQYPFDLPYNRSLEEVRCYLAQNETSLQEIWETLSSGLNPFSTESISIQLETLGISYEQWMQYATSNAYITGQPNVLFQFYGFATQDAFQSAFNLSSPQANTGSCDTTEFLHYTGLTQSLLQELIYEDLSEEEIQATKNNQLNNFYINQGDSSNPIQIDGKQLINLSYANLDRVMRFVRLAQTIGWSFTDLDWALQTINAVQQIATGPTIQGAILPYLSWMQEMVQKGFTVNQCCAFLGEIKTFGEKNGSSFYTALFYDPSKPPLPVPPGGSGYLTWNVPAPGLTATSTMQDKQIETALAAALQVGKTDLINMAALVARYQYGSNYALVLDNEALSLLYRLSSLSILFNKTPEDIFSACEILGKRIGLVYAIQQQYFPMGVNLTILNPENNSVQLSGQIQTILPQPSGTNAEQITYVVSLMVGSTPQSLTVVLSLPDQTFMSISGASLQFNGITSENINKYIYASIVSLKSTLVSTQNIFSTVLPALQSIEKLFSWVSKGPVSLGQLEFMVLGKSNTLSIENGIIGSDTTENFLNQLEASIKKVLVTKESLLVAFQKSVIQLFISLVSSTDFETVLSDANVENPSAVINSLLKQASQCTVSILTGSEEYPGITDVLSGLQTAGFISEEGIVPVINIEELPGALTDIVQNAITDTINSYNSTSLTGSEIFSASTSQIVTADIGILLSGIQSFIQNNYTIQQKIFVNALSGLYHTTPALADVIKNWGELNIEEICNFTKESGNYKSGLLSGVLLKSKKNCNSLVETLAKLQQAAVLMTSLSLSSSEANYFKTEYSPTASYPISFNSIKTISDFKGLIKTFNDSQNHLLNIIINAQDVSVQDQVTLLSKLSGWSAPQIQFLIQKLSINAFTVQSVCLLKDYFDTAALTGINVKGVYELMQSATQTTAIITLTVENDAFTGIAVNQEALLGVSSENVTITVPGGENENLLQLLLTGSGFDNGELIIQNPTGGINIVSGTIVNYTGPATGTAGTYTFSILSYETVAGLLWSGLQAQLAQSPATLTNIQNKLNEKLRDNLVPLAVYNLSSGTGNLLNSYGNNARGLYAYLLIDVEVTGAIQTTYIREAISAVQLYIYRCLNQLEQGTTLVPESMLPIVWQWMQSYREWQANMEVFLYPENYIEPELRVEKTDLFSKAEHALKQADLTNPANVETIFREYMNGFEEIGNLQVISCAARIYTREDAEGAQNFKELCMIGAGSSGHGQYYYRLSRFRESASQNQYVPYDWGQWKKISITMNAVEYQPGKYGIPKPVFAFGRWYIFWVEQKKINSASNLKIADLSKIKYDYYSGTVCLTYLDFNGSWISPQSILKVDISDTAISPVTVDDTNSATTTISYLISTKHDAEVQLNPSSMGNELGVWAFHNIYSYQPQKFPEIISGIACFQYLYSATNAGGPCGLYADNPNWSLIVSGLNILCFGPNGTPYYWFAGTTSGLYGYNYNSGSGWVPVNGIPSALSVLSICNGGNGSTNWLVGTSQGLYYSSDGNTWSSATEVSGNVNCVCYDGETNWYAGTDDGLYMASSLSGSWTQVAGVPLTRIQCLMADSSNHVFAGTSNGLYTNYTRTWCEAAPAAGPNPMPQGLNIQSFYTDNQIWIAGTSSGLYGTNNLHAGWWQVQPAATSGIPNNANVQCLYADTNSNWIVGTTDGLYYSNPNSNWALINVGIPPDVNVQSVYYDDSANWYAATSSGLYTTTSSNFPSGWGLVPLPFNSIQPVIPPTEAYNSIVGSVLIQGEPNWFIVNGQKDQYLNVSYPPGNNPATFSVYRLNSTATPSLGALLNAPDGIKNLLTNSAQQTPEALFSNLNPANTYIPPANYPSGFIDFSNKNAMRLYYWELFFHLPFLVANELNQQQHFAHAKHWYEYIFNPLINSFSQGNADPYPDDTFWRFLGLRQNNNATLSNELAEGEMTELRKDLQNVMQLYASESKPFDPQAIAQLRPIAYQKTIVMHYINNLLAWGDMLYTENTRDSINEAEMLYVLAYNLLGTQPQDLGPEPLATPAGYNDLEVITCMYSGLIGTTTGLYRLDSAGNWVPVSLSVLQSAKITCLAYDGSTNYYAGTNGYGLFSSTDKKTWTSVSGIASNSTITCLFFGNFYSTALAFAGTTSGLYQLTGGNWQITTAGIGATVSVTCLAQDPTSTDNFLFAGTSDGFFYFSSQWYTLADTLPVTGILPTGLSAYFGTPQNGLYQGNSTEYANKVGPAIKWPLPEANITCLYTDTGIGDAGDKCLYAGTAGSGLLYLTTSNSWVPVPGNGTGTLTINCIIRHNVTNGLLYAGTNRGLYYMDSPSGVWSPVQQLLLSSATVTLLYLDANNMLFVVSDKGLWNLSAANAGTTLFDYVPFPLHYFGIPRNQQFLNYWTEVKQRIYNIRHGLTINGQTDNLPLFSPPINPMDLVEAVGSGESVAKAMQLLNTNIPYYRFEVMIEKAKEFTGAVIQFGQSLLSALQTKDAQKLAELYNKNERHILALTQSARQDNLQYVQQIYNSLQQGLANAQNRQTYYSGLINAGWLPGEIAQVTLAGSAIAVQIPAEAIRIASIIGYSIPTIFGFSDGGFHPGSAISQGADMLQGVSNILDQSSNLAGTIAGYQRRAQDWGLQAQLAQDDINQTNYQIVAAQYQIDMAQQEITVLNKQIEQQHKVAEFYKTRFTNEQLYSWYIGQLSALYFQAYQLAHEMAVQAENAWRFEHIGLAFSNQKDNFIRSGYWNSLYEGLLSGESLQLDLLRMEKAFMNQNVRRFEITKTISLAQLHPGALNDLIISGSCQFDITENDFAWDYPGHYCRKIKTVSVSIPMIVGPYQNIHATLTQTSSKIINSDGTDGQNAVQYLLDPAKNKLSQGNTALQANLIPNQQIALSQGVNDTGMFELNFNDARYLPFEGTGAVSSWQLDLPVNENAINYSSITDVIIQINYTALQAGSSYEKAVRSTRGNKQGRKVIKVDDPSSGMTLQMNPGAWAGVTPQSIVQITKVAMVIQSQTSVQENTTVIISETNIGAISFSNWKYNWSFGSANNFTTSLSPQTLTLTVTGALPNLTNGILLVIDYEVSNS